MYYHFAILLMFRPLIKLRIIGSAIRPRDVCAQAADAIQGLLRSYSQLYTLRRTPSFVPYFVLTSSIMHLAIGASASSSPSPDDGRDSHDARDSHDGREGHDAHDAHDGLDSEGVVVKVEDEGTWTAAQAEIQARVHAQTQTQTPGPAERPAEG